MARVLMPKATALWLVQNTQLTTQQIGDFCDMHPLEVKTLSEKSHLQPVSPLGTLQLTQEEIRRCEQDVSQSLQLHKDIKQDMFFKSRDKKTEKELDPEKTKGIAWVILHHPQMPDADIASLLKVGKRDVRKVRTIVASKTIKMDVENPVTLKMCQQAALDRRIAKISN